MVIIIKDLEISYSTFITFEAGQRRRHFTTLIGFAWASSTSLLLIVIAKKLTVNKRQFITLCLWQPKSAIYYGSTIIQHHCIYF